MGKYLDRFTVFITCARDVLDSEMRWLHGQKVMMRIPFKDTPILMYVCMYVCTVDFACLQYYKVEAVWCSVIIRHFASGYVIAVVLIGFRLAMRSNLDNRSRFHSAKKSHLK